MSDLVERLRERRNDTDALAAADELEMLRDWCCALGEVNGHLGTTTRVIREWAAKNDQGGGVRGRARRCGRSCGGMGYERAVPISIQRDAPAVLMAEVRDDPERWMAIVATRVLLWVPCLPSSRRAQQTQPMHLPSPGTRRSLGRVGT